MQMKIYGCKHAIYYNKYIHIHTCTMVITTKLTLTKKLTTVNEPIMPDTLCYARLCSSAFRPNENTTPFVSNGSLWSKIKESDGGGLDLEKLKLDFRSFGLFVRMSMR